MDISGKYVLPGFMEPHMHIESSMLSMTNFSRVVIPHGTTTVVNDPHEIANVLGKRGVRQIMNEGEDCCLRNFFTMPSCVPSLNEEFETNGAVFGALELKALLRYPRAIGLGEVMNYPGAVNGQDSILAEINEINKMRGYKKNQLIIDGHAPGLSGKALSAYINLGVMSDHECSTGDELEEKLMKGMYVMIRNGSSAKNMEALLEHVIRKRIDTRRLMFCTDDKNPHDLLITGHIDDTLRNAMTIATDSGGRLSPLDIIRMATLNVADFFRLNYLGRINIKSNADVVVCDDLKSFKVYATIINGVVRALEGKIVNDCDGTPYHGYMLKTVKIRKTFTPDDFKVSSTVSRKVRVIKINSGQLITDELIVDMIPKDGCIVSDVERDILKIAVINRHTGDDNYTLGFVNGFGMKSGAVATTIGHDSHNLGVIGTNDADMAAAVAIIKNIQGGIVVVENGEIIAVQELSIAGLMSLNKPEDVAQKHVKICEAYKALGGVLKDPIISMGFLQLPVIPHLKITDKTLVKISNSGPEKVQLWDGRL
jgi:adenine deaminase